MALDSGRSPRELVLQHRNASLSCSLPRISLRPSLTSSQSQTTNHACHIAEDHSDHAPRTSIAASSHPCERTPVEEWRLEDENAK